MNENEYIKSRLDDQIAWYDGKSQLNQVRFKWLRGIEIVAAAAVPVLAGYADADPSVKIAIAALGFVVVVVTGVMGINKFQENWLGYRAACEALKRERYFYVTKTAPYDVDEPFPLLVQRTESMPSMEHSNWATYMAKTDKTKDAGASPSPSDKPTQK